VDFDSFDDIFASLRAWTTNSASKNPSFGHGFSAITSAIRRGSWPDHLPITTVLSQRHYSDSYLWSPPSSIPCPSEYLPTNQSGSVVRQVALREPVEAAEQQVVHWYLENHQASVAVEEERKAPLLHQASAAEVEEERTAWLIRAMAVVEERLAESQRSPLTGYRDYRVQET